MCKFFILFFSLFISPFAFSQVKVGNGGGLFENQYVYVWMFKHNYLRPCALTTVCNLPVADREIVNKTFLSLPLEAQNLLFINENDNIAIAGKVFITEPEIGKTVYINSPMLYKDFTNSTGFSEPGLKKPILNLMTALFYHQKIPMAKAEMLAQAIATYWAQSVQSLNMSAVGNEESEISFLYQDNLTKIMISDSSNLFFATDFIAKQAYCETSNSSILINEFSNVHWVSQKTNAPSVLAGSIKYSCEKKTWSGDFKLTLIFDRDPNKNKELILREDSVQLQLFALESL